MLFFILIIILVIVLARQRIEAFTGIPFRLPLTRDFFDYNRKQKKIGVTSRKWIKYFNGNGDHVEQLESQTKIVRRIIDGTLNAGVLSASLCKEGDRRIRRLIEVDELYSVVIVPNLVVHPLLDASDITDSHRIGMLREGGDTIDHANRVFGFLGKRPQIVPVNSRDELVKLYQDKMLDGVYLMIEPSGNKLLERLSKAQKSHLIGFSQLNNGHLFNRMPEHEHRFYKQNPGLNKKLLDIIGLVDRYPYLKINKGYAFQMRLKHKQLVKMIVYTSLQHFAN